MSRRKYSPTFMDEAVQMVRDGHSVNQVAVSWASQTEPYGTGMHPISGMSTPGTGQLSHTLPSSGNFERCGNVSPISNRRMPFWEKPSRTSQSNADTDGDLCLHCEVRGRISCDPHVRQAAG